MGWFLSVSDVSYFAKLIYFADFYCVFYFNDFAAKTDLFGWWRFRVNSPIWCRSIKFISTCPCFNATVWLDIEVAWVKSWRHSVNVESTKVLDSTLGSSTDLEYEERSVDVLLTLTFDQFSNEWSSTRESTQFHLWLSLLLCLGIIKYTPAPYFSQGT